MIGTLVICLAVGTAIYENDKRKAADFEFDLRCSTESSSEQRAQAEAWGTAMAEALAEYDNERRHEREWAKRMQEQAPVSLTRSEKWEAVKAAFQFRIGG